MTLEGTANKTLVLLGLLCGAALWTWQLTNGTIGAGAAWANPMPWAVGGGLAAFAIALVTMFKPTAAPVTAPLYALAKGLFLGWISAVYNAQFGGIVFQAVSLTVLTLVSLLVAYRAGLIRATAKFKLGVFAATGAVALLYLVTFVMHLFGATVPFLHDSSPISIGLSTVIVIIAALNLVLDFDFIEEGVKGGAPRYVEWYAAYGLLITLVWLYIEILRLLAKLRSRD
jgi:uncharacterized YccA/Bax inhibitor family protein